MYCLSVGHIRFPKDICRFLWHESIFLKCFEQVKAIPPFSKVRILYGICQYHVLDQEFYVNKPVRIVFEIKLARMLVPILAYQSVSHGDDRIF